MVDDKASRVTRLLSERRGRGICDEAGSTRDKGALDSAPRKVREHEHCQPVSTCVAGVNAESQTSHPWLGRCDPAGDDERNEGEVSGDLANTT